MLTAYLVPIGRDRFELYSEAPEEPVAPADRADGFFKRHAQQWRTRWHDLVHTARRRAGWHASRWSRWRDEIVCRLAESIAEQRTLWALRHSLSATAVYPADLGADRARAILNTILAVARRHHLRWLAVDAVFLVASGLLMLVPGPNLLAYYFAFRVAGHYLSWRGASHAIDRTTWTLYAEPALVELGVLAHVARDVRRSKVEAIAARLNLPRLAAFFDRIAVPAA